MTTQNDNGHKAIPNSLIKRQLVDHAGKAFLQAAGKLKRTDDHAVVFAAEIAPFGKELKNPRVHWTGPIAPIKVAESDIFKKGGQESITFTWEIDPMEVLFAPNQFASPWVDGIEYLKKGYIQMSPGAGQQAFMDDPKKKFCFRAVVVAKSYEDFDVVLETIPCSIPVLKGCPWAESLMTGACEVERWKADCDQILSPDYGMGILPYLQDDRLPHHQKECTLPSSNTIRRTMFETLSVMGTSPELEDDEMSDYNPLKKRKSPVMPNISPVEDAVSGSRKRTLEEVSPDQDKTKTGNMARIQALLGGLTPEERLAMNVGAVDAGVSEQQVVNKPVSTDFDTPASIGMDVTGLLARMPAGTDRNQLRHMTFANIEKVIKLTNDNLGAEDKSERVYLSATETRMIEAEEHNRKEKLHRMYFAPGSLADPSDYWEQHPIKVEPHPTGIPLTHVGLENMVAPLAIERAGDQSIRLYISYFMAHNVNVQQRAPKFKAARGDGGAMGMTMDENWREATKVSQIQDAVYAYMFVMADLHPRYYGARNLLWLMHKLDWLTFRHDRVFALKAVIDGVLARYNYLAIQRKPPLSFKELEQFAEKTLRGIGGISRMPDRAPDYSNNSSADWNKPGDWHKDNAVSNGGRGGINARGGRGGHGAPSASAGYLATASRSPPESLPLCHQFNSQAGCPREASGRRCLLSNGKPLLHLCNKTDAKGEECLAAHARPNHK